MIRSASFKPVRSDFQKKLADNISNIKSSENLLIFIDKTTNLYGMTPEQFNIDVSRDFFGNNDLSKRFQSKIPKGQTQPAFTCPKLPIETG